MIPMRLSRTATDSPMKVYYVTGNQLIVQLRFWSVAIYPKTEPKAKKSNAPFQKRGKIPNKYKWNRKTQFQTHYSNNYNQDY